MSKRAKAKRRHSARGMRIAKPPPRKAARKVSTAAARGRPSTGARRMNSKRGEEGAAGKEDDSRSRAHPQASADPSRQEQKSDQPEGKLSRQHKAALQQMARQFGRAVPAAALSAGAYEVPEEQQSEVEAPDGLYRIGGGDWLFTIKGGKFTQAERATPPDFGGPDVVIVADD